jgi:hypothetical protein
MAGAIVFDTLVQEDLDVGTGQVDKPHPASGIIRGTRINLQSLAFASYNSAWAPGAIPAQGSVSVAITLTGVRARMLAVAWHAGIKNPSAFLKAETDNDTVTVSYMNISGAPVNPGSGNLRILVFATNLIDLT